MRTLNVKFIDQSGQVLATAQVADEGAHFGGSIDLRQTPANIRALFDEFEEIVNGQMLSFLDAVQDKIDSLNIKAVFENEPAGDIKNLQVFPSAGEASFRLAESIREPGSQGVFEGVARVAKTTPRLITITQGNLDHNHIYITDVTDLFPDDVMGGPDESQAAPRTVRVQWGSETVDTDIVREKNIFRRRGWVRKFFSESRIAAGDHVLLEQIDPYLYRVSRVESYPGCVVDG